MSSTLTTADAWDLEEVDLSTPSTPAACSDAEPELFFSDDMGVVDQAKQICRSCPVREQCLAAALDRAEPHGVWGGELFQDGVVIARKRPRGRPRKHPIPDQTPLGMGARAA
ncbi:WhiB family transcriptional regulator [Luteococcus sp. Sow4_B9]|uniref:WhiB family transcriptional regulator n=1 Tax=Luteococcus sp. Sow4_B9 TaxID=3438792 RepID=UPI003F9BBCB3